MSAKTTTTGRRTPLSLSGATTVGKNNPKPTPNSGSETRKDSINQKTDNDKSTIKDTLNKDKKITLGTPTGSEKKILNQHSTESNSSSSSSVTSSLKKSESYISKDSPRKDEKASQNGVSGKSNGSAKEKNAGNSESAATDKATKVEKGSDKDKDQQKNSSNAQQKDEKTHSSKDKLVSKNESTTKALAVGTEKSNKPNSAQQVKSEIKKSNKSDSPHKVAPEKKYIEKKNEQLKEQNEINTTTEANNIGVDHNSISHPVKKDIGATTETEEKKKNMKSTVDLTNDLSDTKDRDNDISESTSAPLTPTRSSAKPIKSSPSSKPTKTPVVEPVDIDMMEPLTFDSDDLEPVAIAASTPGKVFKRKDGPLVIESKEYMPLYSAYTPLERKPSGKLSVSGRRSIHPSASDYKPMQGFYRKMKTDLDSSCNTNSSINVTVGSEVPNNASFSYFGPGRKRDHTPANSQSELETMADVELSPKRPRIDVSGFLSVFASPITLLRSRFSKASIQSSTPVKNHDKTDVEKPKITLMNVNDISFEKDVDQHSEHDDTVGKMALEEDQNLDTDEDVSLTNDADIDVNCKEAEADDLSGTKTDPTTSGTQQIPVAENTDDIKVTVTPIVGDKKRQNCSLM